MIRLWTIGGALGGLLGNMIGGNAVASATCLIALAIIGAADTLKISDRSLTKQSHGDRLDGDRSIFGDVPNVPHGLKSNFHDTANTQGGQ